MSRNVLSSRRTRWALNSPCFPSSSLWCNLYSNLPHFEKDHVSPVFLSIQTPISESSDIRSWSVYSGFSDGTQPVNMKNQLRINNFAMHLINLSLFFLCVSCLYY